MIKCSQILLSISTCAATAWPGDERPGQLQRVALQPDHTHFVMLPSEDEAGVVL
jgi:hypothetical protein